MNSNQLPEGYQFASKTPQEIFIWEPSNGTDPEMNFNNRQYVILRKLRGKDVMEILHEDVMQQIIQSPESQWEDSLKTMKMMTNTGGIAPAHLPNLIDLNGKVYLPQLFSKLSSETLEYSGPYKVVPKCLEDIVDPKPVVKFKGIIYPIDNTVVPLPIRLHIGSYTDVVQVFQVQAEISLIRLAVIRDRLNEDPACRYHLVQLTPEARSSETLKIKMSIIVWNARGVCRPLFIYNFHRLFAMHNPALILITETRCSHVNFEDVFARIARPELDSKVDESIGLMSGVVLMWNKCMVKVDATTPDQGAGPGGKLRLLADIKENSEEAGSSRSN